MVKKWWFQFDFRVWRTDSDLRRCSLETRAFWLEVLCIMHETDDYELHGSFSEIARLIGCETAEAARCVTELSRTNTADVTISHDDVTVISRRLQRELKAKKDGRLRKRRQRERDNVTPLSHDIVISKSKSNKKEEEEREGTAIAVTHFSDSESVALYREFFPNASLPPYLEDLVSAAENIPLWREALVFWKHNGYRAQSVGKILAYYEELKSGKHNGKPTNGKREHANTTALREWKQLADSIEQDSAAEARRLN